MKLLCTVALLALLACASATKRDLHSDEDLLPGWKGTDYQPQYAIDPTDVGHRMGKMKVLDADARIFLIEGLLSDEECDHIIKISEPMLSRSGVVETETGGSKVSDIRTSSGVFLNRGQDDVVKRIEERIAAVTLLPVGNGEGLQVLKYTKDQKYDAHWDYFFHKDGISNGGNRYATVLTYLSTVEEGGETVFPNIPAPGGENVGFSECARYHLAAKPIKGNAVLFHSIKPTGELERKSLHTACPVIKGVKWSMPKWIHVGHYSMGGERAVAIEQKPQKIPKPNQPEGCTDGDDLCSEWAEAGECDRNPTFMVGSRGRPGKCISSCDRCDIVTDSGAERAQHQENEAAH
mmetsp:Transcript_23212/g.59286  ORF Transcript_23212/g.59286 Transcript_23212/m.59286 type:complete len:349 (-) Transcript_23212:555-1601(-)|eukprot:CAMPEP_0202865338 /NCGR_PEP_ID=MMETSP1391-20130828/5734_1 /ASSEMBLY_ACC=CAM_ASM_000867 /TAXON_ID=1034604 /ORGANISM="Chlamydomonas leiostraca, Strain SAG 11-49" /LENGTH=348 /DNA_ID=CAMNT_0049545171 /DNA_START=140 /DNA_END=1186 /DNA_ORIENTATION=+